MTRWLASIFGALLLALVALGALLYVALDRFPLVDRSPTISPSAVADARRLLAGNDPRRLQPGERRQVAIPAPLLDEALNYLASRSLQARGGLLMQHDTVELRLSKRLPWPATALYLNLRATIGETAGEPRIASAFIGQLPIPGAVAELALAAAVARSPYDRQWATARNSIRRVAFAPERQAIVVNYAWAPALLEDARTIALDADEQLRIEAAQRALVAFLDQQPAPATRPLADLLQALLATTGEQAREQRRAMLVVLSSYLAGTSLKTIIPQARHWPRPRAVKLTLFNRHDSAQHFVVSAALAAWAGDPLADAIGVAKEVDDARHGSGFSFADLAADRAGSRFGELVANDGARLDRALAGRLTDDDLAPALHDFPDNLSEREFKRRYGGPQHAAYQQVVAEIERRLAALPLYR